MVTCGNEGHLFEAMEHLEVEERERGRLGESRSSLEEWQTLATRIATGQPDQWSFQNWSQISQTVKSSRLLQFTLAMDAWTGERSTSSSFSLFTCTAPLPPWSAAGTLGDTMESTAICRACGFAFHWLSRKRLVMLVAWSKLKCTNHKVMMVSSK